MTPKQQRFVAEYLKDLNATQAAIRSGYATKSARQMAAHLLSKTDIAAAVAKGAKKRIERVEVQADDVLRELMHLGYSDLGAVMEWGPDGASVRESTELAPAARRAVESVRYTEDKDGRKTIHIKQHSKEKALELLGKHLGLFVDRLEIRGLVGVVDLTDDVRQAREGLRAVLGDAF